VRNTHGDRASRRVSARDSRGQFAPCDYRYLWPVHTWTACSGGQQASHAVSAVGELQKRLAQPPPSIRTILPDIPLPLDQLITKCTEPHAANRYQTTTELVAAIERLDANGSRVNDLSTLTSSRTVTGGSQYAPHAPRSRAQRVGTLPGKRRVSAEVPMARASLVLSL
jgi:hypothetical protein